ncbi:substrate-binding domain-containing protein [Clostridium sp. AM58-1XD]|uniref:substrate-binding domain-containing protein n=1 Tax=Clostridium sp. AM58-1XD TaxID=2292307 RepID=UPI000E4AD788|nr:substrate-binding domain-containing protein [Clostridium sp. AM58-1XD]RGY96452.1 sugar ABC transporter substrate-binding protein [Clostridium sp. AM58-1XD]
MKRKTDRKIILLFLGVFFIGFLTFLTRSYYDNVLDKIGADNLENVRTFKYHFVAIVDNSELPFWQDVFQSMKKEAENQEVLLELWGKNKSTEYTTLDFMDMGIAAKVDGIILEYTGEWKLEGKIKEAQEKGIPVVTILKDAPNSRRVSYVGINSYQLGQEYGRQVLKLLPEGEEPVRVMALLHDSSVDGSQSQILNQINNILVTEDSHPERITVEEQKIGSVGNFEAEETIWNIFQSPQGPPDVFICMNETDTEAVYQAVIDFNMVGEVQLIAYYQSEQIIEAIKRGRIPVTMIVDIDQIGRYSVEALAEYLKEGRVNSYYSVDLQFVNRGNLGAYVEKLGGYRWIAEE